MILLWHEISNDTNNVTSQRNIVCTYSSLNGIQDCFFITSFGYPQEKVVNYLTVSQCKEKCRGPQIYLTYSIISHSEMSL